MSRWDPSLQVTGVVHFHADGTMLASLSMDDYNPRSPLFAAWERIGPRTVRVKHLILEYADPAAVDPSHPITMLTEIVRNTVEFTFSEDFKSYEGTWVQEYFLPEQLAGEDLLGPLNPNTTEAPLGGDGAGSIMGGWFGGVALEVTPFGG